jgi:hypothetical protein
MKKSIFLALSFFIAQTLTAQYPPGAFRYPEPKMDWPESFEAISDKEEIITVFPEETTGQTTNISQADRQILNENRVDRLEFNSEKGITLPGGTVAELLNQNPCCSFDLTTYEQLPLSSNIQVLINQEPMFIMATQVTAALRQIPAEKIKAIEISTNPAANPGAAGAVDIIISITRVN